MAFLKVKDVATIKLELFPVQDCVIGIHDGERQTVEGAQGR